MGSAFRGDVRPTRKLVLKAPAVPGFRTVCAALVAVSTWLASILSLSAMFTVAVLAAASGASVKLADVPPVSVATTVSVHSYHLVVVHVNRYAQRMLSPAGNTTLPLRGYIVAAAGGCACTIAGNCYHF